MKKSVAAEPSKELLTPEALDFIKILDQKFEDFRRWILEERKRRQDKINRELPDFLFQTAHIRNADWRVGPIPADLQCRKVEITGPASRRKMVVNALNSGADCYMADAEDSESPTWENILLGQKNLYDAIRRQIDFTDPVSGKEYKINDKIAVLMFRPRGWHLSERHLMLNDGRPVSASLFDFGLYFFLNAKRLLASGTGVYLYLPKLQSYEEADVWAGVFRFVENYLGVSGAIKATVLIETLPAVFEMDKILYQLRDYITGLNCGRWDYIFSYIKTLGNHRKFLLPDRHHLTMSQGFLRSYMDLLVKTCHHRGAFAMGGMSAYIPVKDNPQKNAEAMLKIQADKALEVMAGCDGTWVAHPALVDKVRSVFEHRPGPNQLEVLRENVKITAEDLLKPIEGTVTMAGLRGNIGVAIRYVAAWLSGTGCVPINNLMEDMATAEIARVQVWQWIKHRAWMGDRGNYVMPELVYVTVGEELEKIKSELGDQYDDNLYRSVASRFFKLVNQASCPEFLTTTLYKYLP